MTTTTFTRSTEIAAPVQEVFDFVGDPVRLFSAWPMSVSLEDVQVTPEGVGTTYRWTGGSEWGHTLHGSITREVHLPNERIVERSTTGSIWRWTFHAEGAGSRLTVEVDHSARLIGGVDPNVMRMTPRDVEEMLAVIRQRVEHR